MVGSPAGMSGIAEDIPHSENYRAAEGIILGIFEQTVAADIVRMAVNFSQDHISTA